MSDELKFIWIDDLDSRINQSRYLTKVEDIRCDFEIVRDKDLLKLLKDKIFKKDEPDLILIDHRLDKVKSDLIFSGALYADIIRERWPECPIIAVTAVKDLDTDTTYQQRESYDEIFKGNQIKDRISTLISIAKSNLIIRNKKPKNVIEILRLLKAPDDNLNRIKSIIPENITTNFGKPGLTFELSKWIRKTLFSKPGFLYDKLWTSTLIGIKEESFNKVEVYFKKALYDGLYSNNDEKRWWQSLVKDILFNKFPDTEEYLPWKLGENFDEIGESDISKCYVCGERFPETVAYTDESMLKRKAMHIRCTEPFLKIQNSIYFDQIRIMKEI